MSDQPPDPFAITDPDPWPTDPRPAEPPTIPGYRTVRILGRGGFSVVHEAIQSSLERRVALKIIRTEGLVDETLARREGRLLASLEHPGVSQLLDFGQVNDLAFLATPFDPEERPLSRLIAEQGPVTWSRTVHLVKLLADALAHVHELGILHRDIKCSNVLVRPPFEPRLIDFGAGFRRDFSRVTTPGTLQGTLAYLAPEVLRMAPHSTASDLYAVGVVMLEMMEGRNPFAGETQAETLSNVLNVKPDLRSLRERGAPEELLWILGSLLEKDPRRRPGSARELERRLAASPLDVEPAAWSVDTSATAPGEPAPEHPTRKLSRTDEHTTPVTNTGRPSREPEVTFLTRHPGLLVGLVAISVGLMCSILSDPQVTLITKPATPRPGPRVHGLLERAAYLHDSTLVWTAFTREPLRIRVTARSAGGPRGVAEEDGPRCQHRLEIPLTPGDLTEVTYELLEGDGALLPVREPVRARRAVALPGSVGPVLGPRHEAYAWDLALEVRGVADGDPDPTVWDESHAGPSTMDDGVITTKWKVRSLALARPGTPYHLKFREMLRDLLEGPPPGNRSSLDRTWLAMDLLLDSGNGEDRDTILRHLLGPWRLGLSPAGTVSSELLAELAAGACLRLGQEHPDAVRRLLASNGPASQDPILGAGLGISLDPLDETIVSRTLADPDARVRCLALRSILLLEPATGSDLIARCWKAEDETDPAALSLGLMALALEAKPPEHPRLVRIRHGIERFRGDPLVHEGLLLRLAAAARSQGPGAVTTLVARGRGVEAPSDLDDHGVRLAAELLLRHRVETSQDHERSEIKLLENFLREQKESYPPIVSSFMLAGGRTPLAIPPGPGDPVLARLLIDDTGYPDLTVAIRKNGDALQRWLCDVVSLVRGAGTPTAGLGSTAGIESVRKILAAPLDPGARRLLVSSSSLYERSGLQAKAGDLVEISLNGAGTSRGTGKRPVILRCPGDLIVEVRMGRHRERIGNLPGEASSSFRALDEGPVLLRLLPREAAFGRDRLDLRHFRTEPFRDLTEDGLALVHVRVRGATGP